jgi:hypothetical protein
MASKDQQFTLELIDHPHGRCQAILMDLDGSVSLDRIYKTRASAQASVDYRLKKLGLGRASLAKASDDEPATEAPSPEPEQAPTGTPSSPTERWLLKLRHEAQRALDEALKLRERAELLELEHKRLTAAADVLEGPEG